MLDGVSAFMSSHRSGGDAVAGIDGVAEVDRLLYGIVVIRQLPIHGRDPHVFDAILAKHALSHFASRQASGQGHLRILFELAF